MLAAVPSLRAFAISLCGNVDRADDLVQETLLRAMANIDSFQPGTNMSAWLFTILRNLFRSEYRKRRREVEDADGSYAESLNPGAAQPRGVRGIPRGARQAAAGSARGAVCWWAPPASPTRRRPRSAIARSDDQEPGQSRAHPASELLSIDSADEFGPDHTTRAILTAGGRLI